MEFRDLITLLIDGKSLDRSQMEAAMQSLMTGEWDESKIAAFLATLRAKGETIEEIAGAAAVMRNHVRDVRGHNDAVDLCGTGGDGAHTINVSTTAAFVVAGAGLKVAKHGNRAVSSQSGSADVLEALGANVSLEPSAAEQMLTDIGHTFLFAPNYHPSMKYAMPTRRSLGIRTIFNLLGPLTNPAKVTRQMIGVFDEEWVESLAYVLRFLGHQNALIVHGMDGVDEVSISAPTSYALLGADGVTTGSITPENGGLQRHSRDAIAGGDAKENAQALQNVLSGNAPVAHTDVILLNAGACIWMAGEADDLAAGVERARESIASGAAKANLEAFIAKSKALADQSS